MPWGSAEGHPRGHVTCDCTQGMLHPGCCPPPALRGWTNQCFPAEGCAQTRTEPGAGEQPCPFPGTSRGTSRPEANLHQTVASSPPPLPCVPTPSQLHLPKPPLWSRTSFSDLTEVPLPPQGTVCPPSETRPPPGPVCRAARPATGRSLGLPTG